MKIGIDVSQVVYEGTGVSRYVKEMVLALTRLALEHEFVLFGGARSRRKELQLFIDEVKRTGAKIRVVLLPFPPKVLDFLWNTLHIIPITWFTGPLDVFWSSDWTQPPVGKTIGITTIHDVSFLRYPESFSASIRRVQKRRLKYAKKECSIFLCDSEATKRDCIELLGIAESKLDIVYPGFSI